MKEKKGKFGLKRRNKPFIFSKVKINSCSVLQASLMCTEVSYYHSAKSISGSKNLSSSTVALRKFKKRFTTVRDESSSSECCCKENLQLKVAGLTQQPKKIAKKWLN